MPIIFRHCIRILLTSILLLLLSACHPSKAGPVLAVTSPTHASSEYFLGTMAARNNKIRSISSKMKVALQNKEGKKTLHEFALVEAPNRIRLETTTFIGLGVGLFLADGQKLTLLLPTEKIVYTGQASARNIARLLRFEMRPEDLADLLLTRIVPLPHQASSITPGPGQGRYSLTTEGYSGKRLEQFEFDPAGQVVMRQTLTPDGQIFSTIGYSDYQILGDITFPLHVTIELRQQAIKLDISFSDLTINGPMEPDSFVIEPPQKFRLIRLDQMKGEIPAS